MSNVSDRVVLVPSSEESRANPNYENGPPAIRYIYEAKWAMTARADRRTKEGGLMRRTIVLVNDKMQSGYTYELSAEVGKSFDPEFRPDLSPPELLRLGIFCGKYMTDCMGEFPPDWFDGAKFASGRRDCSLNYFGVDASQPLSVWRAKKVGFTPTIRVVGSNGIADTMWAGDYSKRILAKSSAGQPCGVTWGRSFATEPGRLTCRRRQRQALLHWAYDSRKL